MLFFTYVQGELVNEWVMNMAVWLQEQVFQNGVLPDSEWLWNKVQVTFQRKFANMLEQESTQNKLKVGIKMGTDGDEYIANFKTLVWKAGYDLRDNMVVDIFTNGLPAGLYSLIYNIDEPRTYEQWRTSVLHRQEKYLHFKAQKDALERNYRSPKKPTCHKSIRGATGSQTWYHEAVNQHDVDGHLLVWLRYVMAY